MDGLKNLRESFQEYVREELLDGDSKYRMDDHGPQVAKKGISFVTFPPILYLWLQRHIYSVEQESVVKVCPSDGRPI